MADYPECEKLSAISDKSQAIYDFVEWLRSGDADNTMHKRTIILATPGMMTGYNDCGDGTTDKCEPVELAEEDWEDMDQWVPVEQSVETMLAKFFKIDMDKVEEEKRAMLEELQK